MAFDAYSSCPGGKGKKIKFCCSDLVGEWSKMGRMLDGDQPLACLDHVDRLDKKLPGRACLAALKGSLQLSHGRADEAEQTISGLLADQPDNPVALGEAAMVALERHDSKRACELLQRVLTASSTIPPIITSALFALAMRFLAERKFIATSQHLLLHLRANPKSKQAWEIYQQINVSPLPLLLKQDFAFSPSPEAPWKTRFEQALKLARRGAWQAAAEQFAGLATTAPEIPEIWRNLAILRGNLGDEAAAAEAWRKFAALAASSEDAVEAEALAQLLTADACDGSIEQVRVHIAVLDAEKAGARLAADERMVSMQVEPDAANEGEPPPRAVYAVLDRPRPADESFTPQEAPRILGDLLVYGRETDREARLELVAARDQSLEKALAIVSEVASDSVGEHSEEVVEHVVSLLANALSIQVVMPQDSPEAHRDFVAAERRDAFMRRLWQVPLPLLDNKTPADVAADPAYRMRLLGLLLRLSLNMTSRGPDFNEIRGHWGLPTAEPVDPADISLIDPPLARLSRLRLEKISDEDLLILYSTAASKSALGALEHLAPEVVARPGLDDKVSKSEAYMILAQLDGGTSKSFEHIGKARDLAVAAGESSAPYDLQELRQRIELADSEHVPRLIDHIITDHIREPGVREAIAEILEALGLINPDGTPRDMSQLAEVGAAAGGGEEPKIWTPGGEQGSEKSSLWLPGMS